MSEIEQYLDLAEKLILLGDKSGAEIIAKSCIKQIQKDMENKKISFTALGSTIGFMVGILVMPILSIATAVGGGIAGYKGSDINSNQYNYLLSKAFEILNKTDHQFNI